MCDVLAKVNVLSGVFQRTDLDFTTATQVRKSIVSMLNGLMRVDGDNLQALDNYIQELEGAGVLIKYGRSLRGQDASNREQATTIFNERIKKPIPVKTCHKH